jgi:hypothetical protein
MDFSPEVSAHRLQTLNCRDGLRFALSGEADVAASHFDPAFDPNVWSGRASQEDFDELAVSGLASMYPAFDWSVALRAIMDISAPATSLADRP